jgi:hypothetical protein
MIETKNVKVIDCRVWDLLVRETYNKPYCLQQQDGCISRGTIHITIPDESQDSEMNDSIPVEVNGEEMGVKFEVWKNTPTDQFEFEYDWRKGLFWERNFYPELQAVANDLHSRGLVEAGDYLIEIEW